MLFTKAKVAVFIDGCFWHSCPDHGTTPKSNSEWWSEKLGRNIARDFETNLRLIELGWCVLRFWEHVDSAIIADEIGRSVARRRKQVNNSMPSDSWELGS